MQACQDARMQKLGPAPQVRYCQKGQPSFTAASRSAEASMASASRFTFPLCPVLLPSLTAVWERTPVHRSFNKCSDYLGLIRPTDQETTAIGKIVYYTSWSQEREHTPLGATHTLSYSHSTGVHHEAQGGGHCGPEPLLGFPWEGTGEPGWAG